MNDSANIFQSERSSPQKNQSQENFEKSRSMGIVSHSRSFKEEPRNGESKYGDPKYGDPKSGEMIIHVDQEQLKDKTDPSSLLFTDARHSIAEEEKKKEE